MTSRVVYTAIFGAYDHIKQPRVISPDTNYYLLTDKTLLSPSYPWRLKTIDSSWGCPQDSVKAARWCKTHPQILFPRANTSIWIDGNIRLLTSVDELEKHAFWQSYKRLFRLGLFSHPHRSCIYQEAQACIAMHKGDSNVINAQMARYRHNGYPTNAGLVATGVVVRQHCPEMECFNRLWWSEIRGGSIRDQLSFNYVARERHMRYGVIPGSIFNSPFVRVEPHANQEG